MPEWLDLLQWPAMVATLLASYLVGSNDKRRRNGGFWIFLASNLLWLGWGLQANAHALMVLQLGLAAMNIRGMVKTEKPA